MKSLNRIQLIGWLGKDPEIKCTNTGARYAQLRIATDYFFRSPDGKTNKSTTWHTIKVWDAAIVSSLQQYLLKGSHVLIEGRVVYRTYNDAHGHTRYVTEIKASQLVDLDR